MDSDFFKKRGKNLLFSVPYFSALWALNVLALFVLLWLGRAVLWAYSGARVFDEETLSAWAMGGRFDMLSVAYLSMPILFCTVGLLLFPPRSRGKIFRVARAFLWASGAFVILAEIINFGFFCEYQDQFNVWVLGLANDDVPAIFSTIVNDIHWGRYLLVAVALLALWCGIFVPWATRVSLRFGARRGRKKSLKVGLVFALAMLVVAPIFFRGGFQRRPPRLRDATFCLEEKKNSLILNPVFALKHVCLDLWMVSNGGKPPDFVRDVPAQAKLLFGERAAGTQDSILALITKKNERLDPASAPMPSRVYLIVMESYDRWPMTEKYRSFGLCDALSALEKKGASAENFISGATGTMWSLSAIISGIPYIDISQNYRPSGMEQLQTGVVSIFKRLGYKTRLAYCGYGKWQHIAEYATAQGFDEIVFGDDIPDSPEELEGEWGVPDGVLFRHLEKLSAADGDTPVFTLVMSASYHPPYKLPLKEMGYDGEPRLPDELKNEYDGSVPMNVFAHFKYSDRVLGEFVDSISRERPDSVFAITGDHFSRRFLNKNPPVGVRFQVPFVLVGAGVPAGTKLPFGTHEDIVPTLLAVCAPEGFEYPCFGENLFSAAARSRACALGGGGRVVLYNGGGALYNNPQEFYGVPVPAEAFEKMKKRIDAHRALAWFYFEKGDSLKNGQEEK